MRPRFAAGTLPLLLVLAVLLPGPAGATPATGAFDSLRAELQSRRDGDFSGPLTALQRKRQKAVLKGLALLDRTALDVEGDLGVDIKAAGALLNSLGKAYSDEFSGQGGPLLSGLAAALVAFQIEIDTQSLPALTVRIHGLIPSPSTVKAGKARDAAVAAFAGPVTTPGDLARVLLRTWKLIAKAGKASDKAVAYPILPESMTLTAGSLSLTADEGTEPVGGEPLSRCEVWDFNHALIVHGTFTDPLTGDVHSVRFSAYGVAAPGTFDLMVPLVSTVRRVLHTDLQEDDWLLSSGTMEITVFDLTRGVVSGHLDALETAGPSMPTYPVSLDFTVHAIVPLSAGPPP